MPKFIQSEESGAYKERLKAFMASTNPKPDEKTLEKLREQYLKARETK